jgi:hypothetical protein
MIMYKPQWLAVPLGMVLALALQPNAYAASSPKNNWIAPQDCSLSIPTTDTGVRPKASGFRNEGTGNAFVICPANPTGASNTATAVYLFARSFDGQAHTFDCTFTNAVDAPVYNTKSVTVASSGETGFVQWTPADLGGSDNFDNYISAVTCILPPGASLQAVNVAYPFEIGS